MVSPSAKLALVEKHAGQIIERMSHESMLVPQQFSLHRQRFALHDFGLGQLALTLEQDGQASERLGHVWMLVA